MRLWDPTSLLGFRWPSGLTRKIVVTNIGWMRLSPCQWLKFGLRVVKWLIKKSLKNFCIFCVIAVFNKQANIPCSIGSISRPIFLGDHKATDQVIEMAIYQNYFRKLANFFSGKQQGAVRTDQKTYSLLISLKLKMCAPKFSFK